MYSWKRKLFVLNQHDILDRTDDIYKIYVVSILRFKTIIRHEFIETSWGTKRL